MEYVIILLAFALGLLVGAVWSHNKGFSLGLKTAAQVMEMVKK